MALSFSPRVRRNLAQQMAFSFRHPGSASTSRLSVQALLLISNQVSVPSDSSQLFTYLNTCLNNSANDGTSGANANQQYVLAYKMISVAEQAQMYQSGTLVGLTTPWTMTVNATGTIGSAIMISPTHAVSNGGFSLVNASGGATSTLISTAALDANSATGAGGIMLSKAMTSTNYNLYAGDYYSSFNFITDSIATSGTPIIKVSSMTTTVGQTLTLNGFKLRLNNVTN